MRLDVYRSCSWREKREVLETFWRSRPRTFASGRIHEAALQYAPYAIASLAIVALELVVVFVAALNRHALISWLALGAEGVTLVSLWWAVVRSRALKRTPA